MAKSEDAQIIIQIMPAPGWVALSQTDDGVFHEEWLAAWALVEVGGVRVVQGLIAVPGEHTLDIASDDSALVGYRYVGDSPRYPPAKSEPAPGFAAV